MKKFKKFLLSALSLALVAVLSIGGTLAYLKSEDSDVNVMTMGNVKIAQHEYERVMDEDGKYPTTTVDGVDSYILKKFTQNKPLYPIVGNPNGGYDSTEVRLAQLGHNSRGGMSILKPENVQDKFVVVENTGKSDAYVRTIVAFEAGTLTYEEFDKVIEYSYHFTWERTEQPELIEIDDKKYFVVEFIYKGYQDIQHPNGVLTPGDYTYNSLAQVYMFDTATNEDVKNIDGNNNGRYDILVKSQAVQTKGFADAETALNAAFGETNAENVEAWFKGESYEKTVKTLDELKDAITKDAEITLGDDIKSDNEEVKYVHNNANVIIEGKDYELALGDSANYGFFSNAGSTTTFNDVDFKFAGGGIVARDGAKVTFNSGNSTINSTSTSQRYMFYTYGEGTEVTINGGTFKFEEYKKRGYIYTADKATIIINGGTFGQASNHPTDPTAPIIEDGGQVIINGGTFGFDPTEWVATGHTAVNNGNGTWTVQ